AYCNRNKVVDLVGLPQADICSALQQQKVTHLSSTPTFARLLCDFDKRFESVESITLGGEIADSRLFEQIERSFPNAKTRNIYASTEGGTLMTSTNDVFTIPHELSDKIRLRASELQIHSSLLAESLRSRGDASDYFATGDLIEIVSEEPLSFRFVGRQGDWINVGGTKVNPQRVEEQALLLDGVCEAFAYGKANSVLGNIVCLDVVLADDSAVTPQRIREFLSQKLERFAIPQIIQMVGEIAMTRTQKKSRSDAPKVGNQPAHEGPELDSES
ncbi:MAG: class I adenylate-forming enzyme family protein, partial [Planctomycetota bacterium]